MIQVHFERTVLLSHSLETRAADAAVILYVFFGKEQHVFDFKIASVIE